MEKKIEATTQGLGFALLLSKGLASRVKGLEGLESTTAQVLAPCRGV